MLDTRGVLFLRVPFAPRSLDGAFQWYGPSPSTFDCSGATWYTDGSVFEPRWRDISATGFAVALVGSQGQLLTYGAGIPPNWVDSSAATEAWALYIACFSSTAPPRVVTDCLCLLSAARGGIEQAAHASCTLARAWNLIARTSGGTLQGLTEGEALVWMPSHLHVSSYFLKIKSDGAPICATDFRANRLVDLLDKHAAGDQRADHSVRVLVESAVAACRHACALLAVVTHAANNHRVTAVGSDGTLINIVKREAIRPSDIPRLRDRKRARASMAVAPFLPPAPLAPLEDDQDISSEDEPGPRKRRRPGAITALDPHFRSLRRAALSIGVSRQAEVQAIGIDNITDSRHSSDAPPSVAASVRFSAVLARVREREAAATECMAVRVVA